MDGEAILGSLRSAEALVVGSGPYAGLTMQQVLKDCPDTAYDTRLLRGGGKTATACKAYLKVMKAHDELVAALKACDPAQIKPLEKPSRNSKHTSRLVPVTESLALVPFQGPPFEAQQSLPQSSVAPDPPSTWQDTFFQWRPAWSWHQTQYWCLRIFGLFVTLGLPKLLMQLAGLCFRLFVKKTFFALEIVTDQVMVEVVDAGSMLVNALEQALDIPKLPLLAPPPAPSFDQVKLAAQAASSVVNSLINTSHDIGLIGPAVEAAVSQTLAAQSPVAGPPQQSYSLPGWILVCVGGFVARVLH